MFDSSATPLVPRTEVDLCHDSTWANAKASDVNGWASDNINSLFGYGEDHLGSWYSNNQVFPKSELQTVLCRAQTLMADGKCTAVRGTHTLIENSYWGIAAGDTVDIVWVMNQKCAEFESKLPAETQAEIAKGRDGKFARFPYYKTEFQNHDPISLTVEQATLLAAQSEYVVLQYADIIREVLQ